MMLNESSLENANHSNQVEGMKMQFFLAQLEILQKLHEDSSCHGIYTDIPSVFSPRDMLESNSVWCVHVITEDKLTNQSRQCELL